MKRLFIILLAGVWAMAVSAQSYDEERGLSLYEDERYEEGQAAASLRPSWATCMKKVWA